MAVYCLRNKGTALRLENLAQELDTLLSWPHEKPHEILYQRIPLSAFKMPREALWSLILFHRGRNRETGLYYSRRTLQTPERKPFRIGENLRFLEKEGYLKRTGIVSWSVPQEDVSTGRKNPPLRASFLEPFFMNPTKERWIAMRFLVFLTHVSPGRLSYRDIQEGLSCSTELARSLAIYHAAKIQQRYARRQIQNRVFNWTNERPAQAGSTIATRDSKTLQIQTRKKAKKSADFAPKSNSSKPVKSLKIAESCADSRFQYHPTNKEENPSTRSEVSSNPKGFSESIEQKGLGKPIASVIRFSDLGFNSPEQLPLKQNHTNSEAMTPFINLLGSDHHREIALRLYELARRKKTFQEIGESTLARYTTDVYLEMVRRTKTIRTSPLGYFFAALRTNLSLQYCRLERKQAAVTKRQEAENTEHRTALLRFLDGVRDQVIHGVRTEARRIDRDFDNIPFLDYARKGKIIVAAFAGLVERGELTAFQADVYRYSEEYGATPEAWNEYLNRHEQRTNSEFNAMRHPRKAA